MARKKKVKVEEKAPVNPMAPKEDSPEDEMREGEYDLDQLMRAHEIQGDEKRHTRAMKALEKRKKAITSIEDLKNMYAMKYEQKK